jgi:hypothetical protein
MSSPRLFTLVYQVEGHLSFTLKHFQTPQRASKAKARNDVEDLSLILAFYHLRIEMVVGTCNCLRSL